MPACQDGDARWRRREGRTYATLGDEGVDSELNSGAGRPTRDQCDRQLIQRDFEARDTSQRREPRPNGPAARSIDREADLAPGLGE